MVSSNQNPYPGPRSFQEEDGRYFFGRDEESRQLASLIISHRAVLLYAPSGAGKTSLLKAKVIPDLRERRKVVTLPVSRVGGDLAPGLAAEQVDNIYVFNVLINLLGNDLNPDELISASLLEGLQRSLARARDQGQMRPHLLILDQFEEMFTYHVGRFEERADFFQQLKEALAALPQMSLLISMREDHIARLDNYAAHLPDRLRTRFRMERLSEKQALAAVEQPAHQAGRTFEPGVAQALVDNLRRIQVGPSAEEEAREKQMLGNFVEPVHLQIVCRRLWQNLPESQHTIHFEDVQTFGNVDQALTGFYEETIQAVLNQTSIRERTLRSWIDEKLITPARTRGLVYRGEADVEGLPNPAVDILADAYIVRAVIRGGEVWYELAHDRLVEPILEANDTWFASHQHPVSIAARRWEDSKRDPQLLLSGEVLNETLAFAEANPDELNQLEQEFLAASQQEQRAERTRRLQFAVIGAVMLLILFAALAVWGFSNAAAARREARIARASQRQAETARADAVDQREAAESARGQLQDTLATQEVFLEAIQAEMVRIQTTQTAALAAAYATAGVTPAATALPTASLADTPAGVSQTPTARPALPAPTEAEDSSSTLYSAVESQLAEVRAAQTRMAATGAMRTQSVGRSVQNKPIEVTQLGSGPRHLVLVGGLHAGYAPSSVDLARQAVEYFSGHPEEIPANVALHVFVNANPDSPLAPGSRKGRLNANGVDLNRNWDCNWRASAVWAGQTISGGSSPFSEPETRALRDYLLSLPADAVVFWEARSVPGLAAPGGCGEESLVSEPLALAYAQGAGYESDPFEAYAVNGDGTNWLDEKGIPAISVLLPDYEKVDWERHLAALRNLIANLAELDPEAE